VSQHYRVFMSYSHRDAGIARSLVERLETAGLKCFLSEKDVSAGDLWEDRIRDAIRESDRVVLLVTPRSKNSAWVAAEAGAAWALEKTLIAALMFVEPHELIEPIKRYQARLVESQDQVDAFVSELTTRTIVTARTLAGQWVDPDDEDTVFFRQVGLHVVGYYDYGSKRKKVGEYKGILTDRVFDYAWRWLDHDLAGRGRMTLSEDGEQLSGRWWYEEDKHVTEPVQYRRVSDAMPSWLRERDFMAHEAFLGAGSPNAAHRQKRHRESS